MPNSEDGYSVLKWRVEELEKLVKPLIDLVYSLDKKISLLAQKIVIATILLGSAFQGFGVWYSTHGSIYSEQDKKVYYESRISDSDKIKILEAQLAELKNKK